MQPTLAPSDRVLAGLPSWLGDLVQSLPALCALEERVERLSLAAPAHLLPILEHELPRARRIPHAGRGGERAADWRGHDVAVLFTNSFRSAWTAWRAGIQRRVGWRRQGRALLLTDGLAAPLERGCVPLGLGRSGRWPRILPRPFGSDCGELVGRLGIGVRAPRPRLTPTAAELERARAPRTPFVLAHVGSRPGSAKAYPAQHWARVLERLSGAGFAIVLVGGPGEEPAVRTVAELARHLRPSALVDPPAGLRELAALRARAALVLSSDSGPRHVANAVGARIVTVAGPTDPRHSADHLERTTLARIMVDCGPCHRERCPLAGVAHERCLRDLDPEHVAELALAALAAHPQAP
jgi:heptosyltransferase-2